MKKDINLTLIAVVVIIIAIFGFIWIGYGIGHRIGLNSCPECPQLISSDTLTETDTTDIAGTVARPDADSLISVDSTPFPVPVPLHPPGDTVHVHDTVKFYVWLPLEHRLFRLPDTLDVWYSGINTQIDSVRVYSHNTFITNEFERVSYKMPRLTAELGAGAMYTNETVTPYLLGKVSYNAEKTTFSGFGMIDNKGQWGAGLNVTYRFTIVK